MCKINLNKELNGIELAFDSKPEKATLDAIKAQGFRWNGRKMVWYAKQTADRLTFAQTLGQIETAPKATASINLDNLGENTPHLYGAELAAAIREDLKKRGAKGCTVRTSRGHGLTVTVKASAEDFTSLEEFTERYSFSDFRFDVQSHGRYIGEGFDGFTNYGWLYAEKFEQMTEEERERAYYNYMSYEIAHRHDYNTYHRERANYPQYTTAFCERLDAIFRIANQWNYDNSDIMTDYFDVGYYLDIKIKADEIEPRATMTEAEREAFAEEQRKEEEERARQAAEWEKQREAEREARETYETKLREAETTIYNNIYVEDLDENEQIFVTGLQGCGGKESTLQELDENAPRTANDALITRKIIMSDDIYNLFGAYLLNDWDFVAGKGGTDTEDARLDSWDDYIKLTPEQRETITFYNTNCVGVYVDGVLKMVIDPQGYNYCRYCYLATENTQTEAAADALARLRGEEKPDFFIPAPVEEQAAQLHEGQEITIYQCDGWILNSINAGSGIVTGFYAGEYAQYKGLWITLLNGMKEKRVFIHNGRKCLIYEGIKPALPEEVTRRKVSANMYEMFNADVLLPNAYNYYKSQGITPIIDTCAR